MTVAEKRNRMYEQIAQHGENLLVIFPNATEQDPVKLCKKLRRLEYQAHQIAIQACNWPDFGEGVEESRIDLVLGRVSSLLCNASSVNDLLSNNPNDRKVVPIFVNCDARGYALKIRSEWIKENETSLHTDMGGYGIIAPEFDGD